MRKSFYTASALALVCGSLMIAQNTAKPDAATPPDAATADAPKESASAGGDAAKGKDVFENKTCSGCHNADSTEKKMGPGLKGLFSHDTLVTGKKPTYENVLDLINNGNDNGMPPFKDEIPEDARKNLMAYLQTL